MSNTNLISQIPDNPHIRFDDIAQFQNANTSDLILKGAREDGSVILGNRSVFGRVANWFNVHVFGKIDPNAKFVAELFAKQVSSLSEHSGDEIVKSLHLDTAKSIRNREVKILLNKLGGPNGNIRIAKFRFDDLNPLERRREKMFITLSKFVAPEAGDQLEIVGDEGSLLKVLLEEESLGKALDAKDLDFYKTELKAQFLSYFAVNKHSPSIEQGFEMAQQILRVIALDAGLRTDDAQAKHNSERLDERAEVEGAQASKEESTYQERGEEESASASSSANPTIKPSIESDFQSPVSSEQIDPSVLQARKNVLEEGSNISDSAPSVASETPGKVSAKAQSVESAKTDDPIELHSKPQTSSIEAKAIKHKVDQAIAFEAYARDLEAVEDLIHNPFVFSKDWQNSSEEMSAGLNEMLGTLLNSSDPQRVDLIRSLSASKAKLDFLIGLGSSSRNISQLGRMLSSGVINGFKAAEGEASPGFDDTVARHAKATGAFSLSDLPRLNKEYLSYLHDVGRSARQILSSGKRMLGAENLPDGLMERMDISSWNRDYGAALKELLDSEEGKALTLQNLTRSYVTEQYDALETSSRERRLQELELAIDALPGGSSGDAAKEEIMQIALELVSLRDQADSYAQAYVVINNPSSEQKVNEENISSKAEALVLKMEDKFARLS
jgi:hypothetical protein